MSLRLVQVFTSGTGTGMAAAYGAPGVKKQQFDRLGAQRQRAWVDHNGRTDSMRW